jgi:hypothetical protein
MQVTIVNVLNKDAYDAYGEARKRASIAHTAYLNAEKDAFMELMAKIGVSIGDKVTVESEGWRAKQVDAILIAPKVFAKIKKDGTASQYWHDIYGEYTVEKFTPTPE